MVSKCVPIEWSKYRDINIRTFPVIRFVRIGHTSDHTKSRSVLGVLAQHSLAPRKVKPINVTTVSLLKLFHAGGQYRAEEELHSYKRILNADLPNVYGYIASLVQCKMKTA
jgi:hypothetical protein